MLNRQRFLASLLLALVSASAAASTTPSSSSSIGDSSYINSLLSREISQKAVESVTEAITKQIEEQTTANYLDATLRGLQSTTEDFDEFRELFKRTTIYLPDFESSTTILFADLIVKARNVKCFNIVLGDVQINYALESPQRLNFRVDINDIDLLCTLDYEWLYSFFNGAGEATITANDNFANTVIAFDSVDFNLFPPNASSVASCNAVITITDMEFTGTITDAVLNAFEGLLRGFVEDTVSETACVELGSLGTELVQDLITEASEFLMPYLEPLSPEQTNATIAESLLVVPPEVNLMNFQDEGEDQTWFYGALTEVDKALGVWLIDPNTPRAGGKDLGVNIFLRENILNEDRALELDVEDLPFDFDPILFQGHDALTETTITLETVRVFGLDTFSTFAPFINQGKYTLMNQLSWDYLSFELDVTIDIKPSSLEENVLEATTEGDIHIVEKVKMGFGVDDINATLSLMLAIDSDAFGALKLGPLLYTDNLLPCFWSSVFKSEVTVLEANIGNIRDPVMEGFISKGIDDVVTNSVLAAFLMYESVVIRAMPNIFQTSVKDLLNDVFFLTYDDVCPEVKPIEGLIDFRDLLLPSEEAPALGGSGTEPYGSIASSAFLFLKQQIATVEEDGTLSANDMFIRPFTEGQSGVEGEVSMMGDLFSFSADDIDWAGFDVLLQGFRLAFSDVRIQNLDTMVPPFEFLEPTDGPYSLDNEIHFGPVAGRPLNVSALFSIALGAGSPYYMKNDISLSMTSSAFEAVARVVARVEAMSLLNFPIDDLLNLECWLATIAAPTLNELGLRVDPTEERGLGLSQFANSFQDLNIGVECASCTTTGLNLLPTVLELMKETDVTSVLASRLKFLVQDIIVSDSFETFLARMVKGASQQCPHRPEYTEDASSIGANYADLPVPAMSETSIDTVQFVLATTLQVGFVVFTQLYSETAVEPADALVEQKEFAIPEGSDLLNFSDFDVGFLPSYLETALDELRGMVSGSRIDPASGQEDLAVNIFLRDLIGNDGVFEWDLTGISFGPEDLTFDFHSVRIEGLDSFTKFDVGVPVAPQTILNEVAMKNLVLKLDFGISSQGASQRLRVAFGFDELSASLPLFAAIDKNLLKAIQIGSLLRLPNFFPCFFSAVYGFSFPHMLINVGKIHKPKIEGLMPETDASLTTLVDTLFERYEVSMHESLPSVFDNALRPMVNAVFASFISKKECTNSLLDSLSTARKLMAAAGPPFMDFRDLFLPESLAKAIGGRGDSRYGDLIRSVWGLIEEEVLTVDSVTGESPVNTDIIAPLTEDGNLYFPGDLVNTDFELAFGPVPTGIAFRVSDLSIENLDTVGNPFSLLDPVEDRPSLINNTATIGVGEPLRFGVNVMVDVSNDDTRIRNDFTISAGVHSTTVILAALLKVSEYRFAAFPLGDIFNLDCWLATLPPPAMDAYGVRLADVDPSAAMEELMLTIQKLDLDISCANCSSSGFKDLAELWSTPEASQEMTKAANDLLQYLGNILGDGLVQNNIDRMLNDAARRCPHSPDFQPGFDAFTYEAFEGTASESDTSLAVLVMIVGGSFVVALAIFIFIIRFFVRRRHRRWLKTLPSSQLMLLKQRQEKEEEEEAELNATTTSMFTSKDVPLFVRLVIPVIILGNIGFFLSGHLSLGAEVKIQVSIAGQTLQINDFYQFSMARSTVEIWEAGGKELASLILIFSGIWPYTKQIITFVLWFLPPTRCSISTRGSILLWLDTLAKWSIVDIFTLIMSVAAFRVSVQSPNLGFLTEDLYSLDLLVVPMWGLYANLIAQLISQVSSHFIIHYHRNIVHQATGSFRQRHSLVPASTMNLALTQGSETSEESRLSCPYGERKDLLHEHAFARPHRGESGKLVKRSFVNSLVVFGALVFSVLVVVGCILPSSGLEFLGVLGVAVESGQAWRQAVTKLSLFDLIALLMDQARFVGGAKTYVGMGTLSALLIITVLLVPLAQTAVLMYQWFVPMEGRKRKHMAIAVEVLQAWQYMEVYVISVIVATWQLGPISTFMINGYCEGLEESFNMLAYFGLLESDDAQCFRVDASIESASYILAVAAVLLALLNTFVMNAAKQYFRDRDECISRTEMKERALHLLEGAERQEQPNEEVAGDECEKPEAAMTSEYTEGRKEAEAYIKPVPVLFTDKFRYLLERATPKQELDGEASPMEETMVEKPGRDYACSSSTDEEVPTSGRLMNVDLDDGDELSETLGLPVAPSAVAKGRHRLESDGETSV